MWSANTRAMPPGPVVLQLASGDYVEASIQHTESGFFIYSSFDAPQFTLQDVTRWQDYEPSERLH